MPSEACPSPAPLVCDLECGVRLHEVGCGAGLEPAILGGEVFPHRFVVYESRADHQQYGLDIDDRSELGHPVIFPYVGRIGYVGRESHAPVVYRIRILRIAAHGFQQVGDLGLLEVFRLIAEHVYIAPSGEG